MYWKRRQHKLRWWCKLASLKSSQSWRLELQYIVRRRRTVTWWWNYTVFCSPLILSVRLLFLKDFEIFQFHRIIYLDAFMVKMPASYLCLPPLSSMRNHFKKKCNSFFGNYIDSTENCSCPLSVRNLEFFPFVQLTEKRICKHKKKFRKVIFSFAKRVLSYQD